MTHKYICTATLPDGTEVGELFTTKTSRHSKLIKAVDEAFEKKYKIKFTSLNNTYIGLLDRNAKHKIK